MTEPTDTTLRCPHCGAENLPGRRYCRACGSSLLRRCAACGCEQPATESICSACGAALRDQTGAPMPDWRPAQVVHGTDALTVEQILRAENRELSIVKADLSGYTAMSETLRDPEVVTSLMNQVFEPLVAVVRELGGHVDNYAGDMVIAFFGLPRALENAAERAVLAALRMREELEALNQRLGLSLGISTGVATGLGLWSSVGFGESAKRTVSGELGDVAAELEKLADRGQVAICPVTFDRVFRQIACEQQSTLVHTPGGSSARPAYLATHRRPALAWRDEHGDEAAPLCGMRGIWRRMQAAWQAARDGQAGTLLLCGEPGSGKSRLLLELVRAAEQDGAAVCLAHDGEPLPAETPALVVADDQHDAAALAELSARLRGRPALLAAASAELTELPGAERLDLPPLDELAVAQLATHLRVEEPTDDQIAWLVAWSGGLPLAVRELCDHWPEPLQPPFWQRPPQPLPWRLRELADIAIDALDEPDRALLLAAAAVADEATLAVDPDLLRHAVAGVDVPAALARLAAADLLVEADGWGFRQRLVRYAARARLTGSVRERLQATVRN